MRRNWHPVGSKDWQNLRSIDVINGIVAVELQSEEPETLSQHWVAVVEVEG